MSHLCASRDGLRLGERACPAARKRHVAPDAIDASGRRCCRQTYSIQDALRVASAAARDVILNDLLSKILCSIFVFPELGPRFGLYAGLEFLGHLDLKHQK